MHPQAIIVDATADEEKYFLSGLRDQVRSMAVALIELPENPNTRMSWITKLDSSSLAGRFLPRCPVSPGACHVGY